MEDEPIGAWNQTFLLETEKVNVMSDEEIYKDKTKEFTRVAVMIYFKLDL